MTQIQQTINTDEVLNEMGFNPADFIDPTEREIEDVQAGIVDTQALVQNNESNTFNAVDLDSIIGESLNPSSTKDEKKEEEEKVTDISVSKVRFSDATWFNEVQKHTITIGGQGGIGSWLTLLLSRLSPKSIFIYDNDSVEELNLAGQMYGLSNIGNYKVNAVGNIVHDFTTYRTLYECPFKIDANTNPTPVMIGAFDNMNARKTLYELWKLQSLDEKCLFIDGRLSFDTLQVFCIRGTDTLSMKEYERKWLFYDYEAESTVCSLKQTSFMATMIASVIANCYVNWCAELANSEFVILPFKTEYDCNLFHFKTIM